MVNEKKRGRPQGPMTEERKAAMARGHTEARAVRNYMQALHSGEAPKRHGRSRRSADEISAELAQTEDPMMRLKLRSQMRQSAAISEPDMEKITAEFVKIVVAYSERTGLTYADWREEGVPAAVLKQAGLRRNM